MKKTIMNVVYNSFYQVFILIIPLITIPYISRVLGADSIGVSSFVSSIANFLGTIIVMGMYQLGSREIARSASEKLEDNFFSLWLIQAISGILVILIYVSVILFLKTTLKIYLLLEIPFLIGYMFDISWFFVGIEKVKNVILRNTVVKLVTVLSVFIFVKSKEDLWIYVLILSLAPFVANFVFWLSLHMELKNTSLHHINIKPYLAGAVALFLPQIALQLYTNLDDVLVGLLANNKELAYYDQSQKIARIILGIITSASTVLMPKLAASSNSKKFNTIFKSSLDYTLALSVYFCAMVMINASQFIKWYYGSEFIPMIDNMFFVSIIIIFISYGGVFSNQYMLAKGEFKKFAISYYVGGILNVLLNLCLTSVWKANGATVALILTELFVCLSRIYLVRDEMNVRQAVDGHGKYIFIFVFTVIIGILFPIRIGGNFLNLVLQTLIGTLIFVSQMFLYKTKISKDLLAFIRK